jgi:hypothetical protein
MEKDDQTFKMERSFDSEGKPSPGVKQVDGGGDGDPAGGEDVWQGNVLGETQSPQWMV